MKQPIHITRHFKKEQVCNICNKNLADTRMKINILKTSDSICLCKKCRQALILKLNEP